MLNRELTIKNQKAISKAILAMITFSATRQDRSQELIAANLQVAMVADGLVVDGVSYVEAFGKALAAVNEFGAADPIALDKIEADFKGGWVSDLQVRVLGFEAVLSAWRHYMVHGKDVIAVTESEKASAKLCLAFVDAVIEEYRKLVDVYCKLHGQDTLRMACDTVNRGTCLNCEIEVVDVVTKVMDGVRSGRFGLIQL